MSLQDKLLFAHESIRSVVEVLLSLSTEAGEGKLSAESIKALPALYQRLNSLSDELPSFPEHVLESAPITAAYLSQSAQELNRIGSRGAISQDADGTIECDIVRAVSTQQDRERLSRWLSRLDALDLGPMFAELSAGDQKGTKSEQPICGEDVKLLRKIKRAIPACGSLKAACLQVVSEESEYERLRQYKRRKPQQWRAIMGDS